MTPEDVRPPLASLLSETLGSLLAILRGEIALAKAEMRASTARVGAAAGLMAFAALLGVVGLNTLAEAAVLALIAAGMTAIGAALVVGPGLIALAAILFFVARGRLRAVSLASQRMAGNLRRDAAVVKGGAPNA